MIPFGSETVMSTGTGFVYEDDSKLYLITNGHNVTRVNPDTNMRIVNSIAFPIRIKTKARIISEDNPNALASDFFDIDLYDDDEFLKPKWFIHPTHGYKVDVIAIPFASMAEIPKHVKLFPINKYEFNNQFDIEIADDVFILGYPFDITGGKELPIWKRGTISTEPVIDIENLPKFLVDTATRSGMSGSPVIMQRNGFHGFNGKEMTGKELLGVIRLFAGIYSGRIGAEDNFQTQLGIVWKPSVIDEIISGQKLGDIGFQSI
ncbi:serine protease [Segetibacter sp. 3557_3]|uniref:S1 family peptidase n=1 Tax=Segetibacter sp. 3557_3 TaxID=2547429 RepID=UPI0014044FAF|nr:serine protease [Segetibacter sp. 3557_3]